MFEHVRKRSLVRYTRQTESKVTKVGTRSAISHSEADLARLIPLFLPLNDRELDIRRCTFTADVRLTASPERSTIASIRELDPLQSRQTYPVCLGSDPH